MKKKKKKKKWKYIYYMRATAWPKLAIGSCHFVDINHWNVYMQQNLQSSVVHVKSVNVGGSHEQKRESQSPYTGRWYSTNWPPRAHSDITIISFCSSVCLFVCLFSTSSLHFHGTRSPSGTQAEAQEIKGIFTLKNILVILSILKWYYRRHTKQNIEELYLLSFTPTGQIM